MRFRDLRPGDRARVVDLGALDPQLRARLLSLGLIPGTEFEVERVAPLGDPVAIRVRDFQLGLRRSDAGAMEVERL
ncbi:MAG: iron transporter FeoA [Porticoccaceae bacterium]|nr:MAG: iron transporter FeoA [Porticoccaceae bacterium]